LKIGSQTQDMDQKKKFIDQAIWYSILGAKFNDVISYTRLKHIIDGEFTKKKEYTAYYTFLINFLLQEDAQAKELFTRIALDSKGALNWAEKYIQKLRENEKSPSQLKVLENAMHNFHEENAKRNYHEALQRWEKSPSDAITLLVAAENYSTEANEKLAKLRQTKGYLYPKKVKKNDYGRLLKESEIIKGAKAYEAYCERYKKGHSLETFSFLDIAIKLGNPKAIKESKRLEECYAKGKENSNDFDYRFANQYIGLQSLKGQLRLIESSPVQNIASQKSIAEENTTNASTTMAIEEKTVNNTNNAALTKTGSTLNLSEKESKEPDFPHYETYKLGQTHKLNPQGAAAALYRAIRSGDPRALEELQRLKKSENSTSNSEDFDITLLREYKRISSFKEKIKLPFPEVTIPEVTNASNVTSTPNMSPPKNNDNSSSTLISWTKEPELKKKPNLNLNTLYEDFQQIMYNDYCTSDRNDPYTRAGFLERGICTHSPQFIEELKRLEKSEDPTDIALLRKYKEIQEWESKAPEELRRLSSSMIHPFESQDKASEKSHKIKTSEIQPLPSQEKSSFVPPLPQKGFVITRVKHFGEEWKEVEPFDEETLEHNKSEKKEKKPELPSVEVLSDQAPTQGLEPLNTPVKARRTLQRTQSLINQPKKTETSKEPSLSPPKKTIKRTRSLNQIPTQNQPSEETQTTTATSTTKKKNKFPLTKMSFKTLKLTKKKEKSAKLEETVKQSSSSTNTASSISKSEEQMSKSRGQISNSEEQTSRSEEQTSRSEDYLSTSKEKVPFSKLIRVIELAQNKENVKLKKDTVVSTLKQLNNITWRKDGNIISATHNLNSKIHLTIHAHNESGRPWYKNKDIRDDFLEFVGFCNPDLEDRISKIGKK
jgi:hypothetical protein